MSAKVLVCLLIASYLIAAKPAAAFYSDEYFSVVHVEEIADDDGNITFIGEVINTSEFEAITPIKTHLIIKGLGTVLGVISADPDSFSPVQPGQTTSFTIETDFKQGEYDEFSIRCVGYAGAINPDAESLSGALLLVEENLNFTTFEADSTTVVLGELHNDTNGLLTNIHIEFRLFKDEDCLVGVAIPPSTPNVLGSMVYQELSPGRSIGFIAYSEAHLGKVNRWEYSLSYDFKKLAPVPEESTAIIGTSWGEIKAMGRR